MNRLNRRHLAVPSARTRISTARIKSFETAFGMQAEVPDAFDFVEGNRRHARPYGLQRGSTQRLCLAMSGRTTLGRARRAVCRTDRLRLLQ